jgi:1,2-diacylglycerol 3-alpha-glucosyltransferase
LLHPLIMVTSSPDPPLSVVARDLVGPPKEEVAETGVHRRLDESAVPAAPGKLRIALVADTLDGWVGGGIIAGRRFVDKLRENHRVIAIGAALPESDPDHVTMAGFQLPSRTMREMQFFMARPDRKRLREAFAQVDVVHLHFPFWLSYVALEEARALGLPVVASFHVQPENALLNAGIRSAILSRMMYRLWIDRLYNRTDAVVCPSGFAEKKLRSYGLTVPTYIVSNGTPPDFHPRTIARRPSPDGKIVVLSVGRLSAEKRHDVTIEAVSRSRHRDRIKLVLAGPGTLDPKLRKQLELLPNAAEVGFVERSRLQELFESADIFVHASDIELEGMAVVEAMTMGLPVLVSDSAESAAADFALDDRFRFRSGDPQALADRLDALLDEPDVLRDAGARYAEFAHTLDFGQSVDRLVDVYRTVIGRREIGGVAAARLG